MASDLGPDDVVVCVHTVDLGPPSFHIHEGQHYIVTGFWPLPDIMICMHCLDDGPGRLSVALKGIEPVPGPHGIPVGHCPCRLRKIGGYGIHMTFLEQVLRPVHVPADPILVPEDA